MNVGYVQFNVKRDKQENHKTIRREIFRTSCDIFVFPELCNIGYLFESKDALAMVAENIPNGETTLELCKISGEKQCTIIAGIAEIDMGEIYNSAVITSCGKYIGKYRKIHLSDFEKRFFKKGTTNDVFEVNQIKIGVQICFDLWFPEISREQILKGADLLCVLANFGGITTRKIAEIRAIENLTPLILCNRVGSEENTEMQADFLGSSNIFRYDGITLTQDVSHKDHTGVADISLLPKKSNVMCKDFFKEISYHYNHTK